MHRSIIKRRMNNRLVATHVCHLRQVIKIQCRIRIFLAKKRMKEAVDEERDIAAYIIQEKFRRFIKEKKREKINKIISLLRVNVETKQYKIIKAFKKVFARPPPATIHLTFSDRTSNNFNFVETFAPPIIANV